MKANLKPRRLFQDSLLATKFWQKFPFVLSFKNGICKSKLYSITVFPKCAGKSHLPNHTGNLKRTSKIKAITKK